MILVPDLGVNVSARRSTEQSKQSFVLLLSAEGLEWAANAVCAATVL